MHGKAHKNQKTRSQTRTVTCPSCGAHFDAAQVNCPYCGTADLPAAEAAYMDTLEDLRSDMEALDSHISADAKRHFRDTWKKILPVALVLIGIILAFSITRTFRDRQEEDERKAEYLWQRDYFAQMEQSYESGEYDVLAAQYDEARLAGHSVYQFKHSEFCEHLLDIQTARNELQVFLSGTGSAEVLFVDELNLYRLDNLKRITTEERELLGQLQSDLIEDFQQRVPMTDEELAVFLRDLKTNGFVSYAESEKILKEKGWL